MSLHTTHYMCIVCVYVYIYLTMYVYFVFIYMISVKNEGVIQFCHCFSSRRQQWTCAHVVFSNQLSGDILLNAVNASARQLGLRSRTSQGMSGQSGRYFSFLPYEGGVGMLGGWRQAGGVLLFEGRNKHAAHHSARRHYLLLPVCHPPVSSPSSHVPLSSSTYFSQRRRRMSLHGHEARAEKHNITKVGQILHAAHTSLQRIAAFCRGRCAALFLCLFFFPPPTSALLCATVWGLLSSTEGHLSQQHL